MIFKHCALFYSLCSLKKKRVRRDFAFAKVSPIFTLASELSHFCQHHAKALIHDFAMKTQQELKSKVELFLRSDRRCCCERYSNSGSTTLGTSSKSFAIWLQIPHFSSLRTFRQVLNLGLLTQSHKIGLEGIFFGQCAAASTASTPNPTWIEEKRPKSGFSTSIILHSFTKKLSKSTVDEIVKIPWL